VRCEGIDCGRGDAIADFGRGDGVRDSGVVTPGRQSTRELVARFSALDSPPLQPEPSSPIRLQKLTGALQMKRPTLGGIVFEWH
jgi:hypothetical protein